MRRGRFTYNCPDYSTVFLKRGSRTSAGGDDLKGNSNDTARFLLVVSLREQKNIMLKKYHRFFQSILVMRDTLLAGLSFLVAYGVRFSFPEYLPYSTMSEPRETFVVGFLLVASWPLAGWLGGLYRSRRSGSVLAEILDVLKNTALVFLLVVAVTYFFRDVRYSRFVMGVWALLTSSTICMARVLSRLFLRRLRSSGFNLRHVVIVGTGDLALQVTRTVESEAWLGLRVMGYVTAEGEAPSERELAYPVLGTTADIKQIVGERSVDQVLVALAMEQLAALPGLMKQLSLETVDVRMVPDFYQFANLCGGIEEFSGMPVVNLQLSPMHGWSRVFKRAFDFTFALVGLLMTAPLLGLIALLVRLGSRGPVFFQQERVGIDGRTFSMHKFRSMAVDAEDGGKQMTSVVDNRRTPIGVFLRRTSLDELPQLWNVLRGEMSLVGPRPEQPCFIEDFKKEIPRYALRHKMKAGMTGLAQVNGMRGQTSIAKRIEFDLYYIENWSFVLDLKILVRTICGGFLSPNAY